jgi:hypothetical protein
MTEGKDVKGVLEVKEGNGVKEAKDREEGRDVKGVKKVKEGNDVKNGREGK